jgi:geranylgeranyl diphosphate synthase type I
MPTSLSTILRPYIKKTNEDLAQLLSSKKPEKLFQYVAYQLGLVNDKFEPLKEPKGGKRLRASVPLMTAKYIGDGEFSSSIAMALELFHNFTLIIDDIQDNDTTRRGRSTLWKVIGIPQALNAALIAEALSFECARNACVHLSPRTAMKWYESFQEMTQRVFEGQHLDILYEKQDVVYTAQYLQMARAKTACLLSTSFSCGFALQAKEELRNLAPQMKQVGESAGMAFQIQDDILGLWGDPKKTGKPVGSDLVHHKKTLPISYAMENGSNSTKKLIQEAYSKEISQKDAESLLSCLEVVGAKEYAMSQVREYTSKALSLLASIPTDEKLKKSLGELIEGLVYRES